MIKLINIRHKYFFWIGEKTFNELKDRDGKPFPWNYYYQVVKPEEMDLSAGQIKEDPNWVNNK